jgi:hypothetical protein
MKNIYKHFLHILISFIALMCILIASESPRAIGHVRGNISEFELEFILFSSSNKTLFESD